MRLYVRSYVTLCDIMSVYASSNRNFGYLQHPSVTISALRWLARGTFLLRLILCRQGMARDGKGFKIFCIWASDFCDIRLEQLQSQLPIVAGGTSRKGCGTVETVHFELASLPRTLKISVQMWYLCGAYCWCFWYRCFFLILLLLLQLLLLLLTEPLGWNSFDPIIFGPCCMAQPASILFL